MKTLICFWLLALSLVLSTQTLAIDTAELDALGTQTELVNLAMDDQDDTDNAPTFRDVVYSAIPADDIEILGDYGMNEADAGSSELVDELEDGVANEGPANEGPADDATQPTDSMLINTDPQPASPNTPESTPAPEATQSSADAGTTVVT